MAYVRKTYDEYQLQGYYGNGWEEILSEETKHEVILRLREYRDNLPGTPYRIKKVRVPIKES